MSAKNQIKQIVDYFKREPQLKDKTDAMGDGLLLGANLADEANELSKTVDGNFKILQQEYSENGNGSQSTAELLVARDGEQVINDRLKRDFGKVNDQLAQTIRNITEFPRLAPEVDDTGRFKRLIEATNINETAFVPHVEEWYLISDTVLIDKNINFISEGKIGYTGERTKPTFILDSLTGIKFKLFKLVDGNNATDDYDLNYGGYHGWANKDYIGIHEINLKWCILEIYEVRNFTTGIRYTAARGSGNWFNKFIVKNLINNLIHMDINSDGDGSWNNSNYFYETSLGYGLSHKPFLDDSKMKYGILQTLTNGNRYGGNSNIFYNFKFETHDNFPNGFTQIETKKAYSWEFIKYRNELSGGNTPLLVVDLAETRSDVATPGAHSGFITLDPIHADIKSTIIFKNTKEIRTNYPAVAKVVGWEENLETKISVSNLQGIARKKDANNLSLQGFLFANRFSLSKNDEVASNYGGYIFDDRISIGTSFPLIFYIENIKKSDTFLLETNSGNGNATGLGLELYHTNGTKIESDYIGDERALGLFSSYNSSAGFVNPLAAGNKTCFTVNSEFLGTIKIKLYGNLNGFVLKTDSKDAKVLRTQQIKIKPNKTYFSTKPTLTLDGPFDVGETVYNSTFTVGQPIGWQLSASLVWEPFGTQT